MSRVLIDSGQQAVVLVSFGCPHCGELIDTTLDTSGGAHATIEDCQVCCQPIEMQWQQLDDRRWELLTGD